MVHVRTDRAPWRPWREHRQAWLLAAAVTAALAASPAGGSPDAEAPPPVATALQTQPASQPATQPAPAPTTATRPALFQDEGIPLRTAPPSGLWWQMLASVLVVLVLGAAGLILVKKVLPKVSRASGKKIVIEETIYLAPRQAVHLLRVAGQTFLVASTRESVTLLGELFSATEPGVQPPGGASGAAAGPARRGE